MLVIVCCLSLFLFDVVVRRLLVVVDCSLFWELLVVRCVLHVGCSLLSVDC